MCTVTFIPLKGSNFVLTSNRDEAPNRTSLAPEIYVVENVKVLFPKDKVAGGSWIGTSENSRVLCVLNGGFEKHQRKSNYRLSRGVVVKDLLVAPNLELAIKQYNLKDVEPFTLVLVDWSLGLKLYELVWDGEEKHFSNLPLKPRLWSSSTLYSEAMKKERLQWFNSFKTENELNPEALLHFHSTTNSSNTEYGIVMDRGFVKTTSITQVEKQQNKVVMSFTDLKTNKNYSASLNILHTVNG